MERLDKKLIEYSTSDYYPFHMPGHKRQLWGMEPVNPFAIDITEIDGFDNLHHPKDILKEIQKKAARLYGAKTTLYSVNGSTAALLSAVSACVSRNGKLIMARNCHKAVYHGAYLRSLETVYVYPGMDGVYGLNGGIRPEDIEAALKEHPDAQAVLITSPSYDGIVSDIRSIAKRVHERNGILIVDEAHGAHFGMNSYFPESALKQGADIVIHSLHKTLPSLTQTALLHINSDRVDEDKVRRFMGIYQSSSPSYVLMASMDSCISLLEEKKDLLFASYVSKLKKCRLQLAENTYVQLVTMEKDPSTGVYDRDLSKIVLSVKGTGMSGVQLHQILRDTYHLQMEMETADYVLAMTSIGDQDQGFDRLCHAVKEIDKKCSISKNDVVENDAIKSDILENDGIENDAIINDKIKKNVTANEHVLFDENIGQPEICMKISDAVEAKAERLRLAKAVGRISGEYVYLYPPGIPLIVPGERISEVWIKKLEAYKQLQLDIEGLQDYAVEYINVVREK